MKAKPLDARTLRALGRRFRKDMKGPRRNYEAIKLPRMRGKESNDAESKGYWRGWFCALQQLADELLEDARAVLVVERKAKASKGAK